MRKHSRIRKKMKRKKDGAVGGVGGVLEVRVEG